MSSRTVTTPTAVEQGARLVSVVSCYEAGYDGFWLHRVLSAQGLTNHVIDAASLQVDRRARRVKTDRLDGEALFACPDGVVSRRAQGVPHGARAEPGRGGRQARPSRARAADTERDAPFAAAPAADDPVADKIRALAWLEGIGPTGASVLGREAYYRSFRDRREVGSYVGLTPTPWRSGRLAREQGISMVRQGSP
jgi:transposase